MINLIPYKLDSIRSEYEKGVREGQAVLASEIRDIILHMHNVAPEYGVVIDKCELLQLLTKLLERNGIGIDAQREEGKEQT